MAESMQAVLESCTRALGELEALLEREQQQLRERQFEGLETLLNGKITALQDIERCEAERRRLVSDAGYAADAEGMRAYLAGSADSALESAWQALAERLRAVRAHNDTNGLIIEKGMAQLQHGLALLTGSAPQQNTYGPKGETRQGKGGREISRA